MRTLRYVISLCSQVAPFIAPSVYNPKHDVPRHLMSDSAVSVHTGSQAGPSLAFSRIRTTDEKKTQNYFLHTHELVYNYQVNVRTAMVAMTQRMD
jgi:hypothetical protein